MDVAQEDIVYPKPIGFDTTSSTSVIACFSSEPFITACVFFLLAWRKEGQWAILQKTSRYEGGHYYLINDTKYPSSTNARQCTVACTQWQLME